jgi:hypothetical protein
MAHIRTSIRDNIKTTLTGLTTTGANIFMSRVYPIGAAKLPGIILYTESESVNHLSMKPPRTQMRTMSVTAEIYVRGVSDYDDTIDTISAEIETALYTDITRGGLARDTRVTGFAAQFSNDGDQPVAYAGVTIEVDYVTIEGSPEASA